MKLLVTALFRSSRAYIGCPNNLLCRKIGFVLVFIFVAIIMYLFLLPLFLYPKSNTASTQSLACGYLIRSKLVGGLGNQMFVYASFYGMNAQSAGSSPRKVAVVNVSNIPSELDQVFENLSIPQKLLPQSWFESRHFLDIGERACCLHDNNELGNLSACDGRHIRVGGFRQSFKYFQNVFEEIRREFSFKKDIRDRAEKLISENLLRSNSSKNECTLIGVHLRRGDFTRPEEQEIGHQPATLEYLRKAVAYFERRFYSTRYANNFFTKKILCLIFLVFGSDNGWNSKATKSIRPLNSNTHFVLIDSKHSDAGVDLCAMTLCDHMITSTGTFSWWAGFFSRGIVTYQKEYARPDSRHIAEYVPADYFLKDWIPL